MIKLDPGLLSLLEEYTGAVSSGKSLDTIGGVVTVFVQFRGDIALLEAAGLESGGAYSRGTGDPAIATGQIRVADLPTLMALPEVDFIKRSSEVRSLLEHSVPVVRADQLHSLPTPFKGNGVIVGIVEIDRFNYLHGSLRRPDPLQTTRILSLWDQTIPGLGGGPPGNLNIGKTFSKVDIDAALASPNPSLQVPLPSEMDGGHATHVAGIAAGDGSQSGGPECCRGSGVFVGVAPEADLVLVTARPDAASTVSGVQFIFDYADSVGKPAVVNLSLATNTGNGAHDGLSPFERALDIILFNRKTNNKPGTIVIACGNEGASSIHAQGQVRVGAANPEIVSFFVPAGLQQRFTLEIWYADDNDLDVEVAAPIVGENRFGFISPGTDNLQWPVPGTSPHGGTPVAVVVSSRRNELATLKSFIEVRLEPLNGDGQPNHGHPATVPSGIWSVTLQNPGDTPVNFHAWIQNAPTLGRLQPVFRSHVDASNTITIPATATDPVSVGSFDPFTGFIGRLSGKDELSAFSSRGPRIAFDQGQLVDDTGSIKPEIVAPGVGVISASNRVFPGTGLAGWCCDCAKPSYAPKSGTSMAAPHVTGTVALMLQKNPTLGHDTIKSILATAARRPVNVSSALPDSNWGNGVLDAKASVDAVPGMGGGAGGRGTGGPTVDNSEPDAGNGWLSRGPFRFFVGGLTQLARGTPREQQFAVLLSQHLSEIRGLINANKRIATMWHKVSGPRRLTTFLTEGHSATPEPPDADARARRNVTRLLRLLHARASTSLIVNLSKYETALEGLLLGTIKNPGDFVEGRNECGGGLRGTL